VIIGDLQRLLCVDDQILSDSTHLAQQKQLDKNPQKKKDQEEHHEKDLMKNHIRNVEKQPKSKLKAYALEGMMYGIKTIKRQNNIDHLLDINQGHRSDTEGQPNSNECQADLDLKTQ
jgi:hypothetical protein